MENQTQNLIIEALSPENLEIIWKNKTSKKEMIPLKSELPLRNVLNPNGTRNIEIILSTDYGYFSKTLALVEKSDIIFPNEYLSSVKNIDLGGFNDHSFKREIDLLIGAFSLETMFLAFDQKDVNSYKANGLTYELVVAFDGSIQCFEVSGRTKALGMFDPYLKLTSTEFDEKPLSSFKITDQGLGVYPTNFTNPWVEQLAPQRLLQTFNTLQ
ncbi:hypothetical protein [Algoriphagus formosus]|uniref:hypothetical protein n=1 Tax=Algoriphagus formosus TaxID=2007308 RepID=UPI000C28B258|nr:hypothetical protein [Algoriphagus formosus]